MGKNASGKRHVISSFVATELLQGEDIGVARTGLIGGGDDVLLLSDTSCWISESGT